MDDNNTIKKIEEIYSNFILKMENIINRRKELLKTYRQKLEEAKINEVRDSILK
jgi:hypothetical protein